ncbi:hypothetical protein SK128_013588, partial [Halocaridina rubra]
TSEQQPNPSIPPPDPELDAATPSFSGCGALGFHIRDETLPITRLTECCGTHDACYGSACRVNKRDCDGKLKSCLYSVCDDRSLDKGKQKTCRGAAKLLFSGTMALSFQQYNTAQEKLSYHRSPPYAMHDQLEQAAIYLQHVTKELLDSTSMNHKQSPFGRIMNDVEGCHQTISVTTDSKVTFCYK